MTAETLESTFSWVERNFIKHDPNPVGSVKMGDRSLEALKLISDWSKWLVTIETGAIAVVGAVIKLGTSTMPVLAKICATAALGSFVASIAAAALLLLSLPEIAQRVTDGESVWMTRDRVIGRVFRGVTTQGLAVFEAFFFGTGVVAFAAMILAIAWA